MYRTEAEGAVVEARVTRAQHKTLCVPAERAFAMSLIHFAVSPRERSRRKRCMTHRPSAIVLASQSPRFGNSVGLPAEKSLLPLAASQRNEGSPTPIQ